MSTLNKKIQDIKKADKCRDFKWILEQQENKKLRLSGEYMTKSLFEKFRLFIKCTQEVYEGLWDLDITLTGPDEDIVDILGVVIYFPEITLKNSYKKEHTVTDLFVKISLTRRGDEIYIAHLSGGRMSVSYAEYSSNYFHSHLPGSITNNSTGTAPFYSSFCRGSGHINDFIANINSEGISEERLIPFLIQITGLVSWESLEGGPHRRIQQIHISTLSGRRSNPNTNDFKALKDLVIDYHKNNKITPQVDFKLENGQYIIVDNDKFEKFLTETVPLDESLKRRVICMKDSQNDYYQFGSPPGYSPVRSTTGPEFKYIFQGKELTFKIGEPPSLGDTTNIKYFLHPEARNFIKQELEYDINIKKIRESTIRRYSNKTGNAKEGVRPDKVAV